MMLLDIRKQKIARQHIYYRAFVNLSITIEQIVVQIQFFCDSNPLAIY